MPSAAAKASQSQAQPASADLLQEPLRSCIQVFEKKQRNLEKRKLKIVETKKKADLGGELNDDQKNALANLALVENSLEVCKELHKNVSSLEIEYNKLVRKDQKRKKQEQHDQAEVKAKTVGLKIIEIQGLLSVLTEDVRADFIAGSNGACELTEDELSHLDSIYELVSPGDNDSEEKKLSVRVKSAGQHLLNLVDGKDVDAFEGTTYKQILDILNKIVESGYFEKEPEVVETAEETPEETVEIEEVPEVAEEVEKTEDVPYAPEENPEPTFEETAPVETVVVEEEPEEEQVTVNGVDLPPDVQQSPEDEKIDFLGESEIIISGSIEQPLNPVSPEFIPRNMQGPADDGWIENEGSTGGNWQSTESGNNDGNGWQSVSDTHSQNMNNQGGNRDGYRGRGGNGRGFRGRGRGRGNYRGGRQDGDFRGGNFRGGNRGNRGGNRGNRGARGSDRGDRGGYGRGGNRGGDRSDRGGFGRPQNQ